MTTATNPKQATATEQLEKLVRKRDEARIEQAAIRRERDAYRSECEQIKVEYTARSKMYPEEAGKDGKPLPDTELARLEAETKRRWPTPFETPWPEQEKLDKATAKALAAEEAQENFRIINAEQLIAETCPDLTEQLTDAWQQVANLAAEYLAAADRVTELVNDLPQMLDGRDTAFDGRVREWADLARKAIENPPAAPSLTHLGFHKLSKLKESINNG